MTGPASGAAVVRRVMPARPELVYDAWLDPDALAEWMCPRPARATRIDCDPRVGGMLRLDIDDAGLEMTVTGRYLALHRPRRIQFTWYCSTWAAADQDSVVTVDFEPHGEDATLMTIEHVRLRGDLVDRHEQGWVAIAEQFAAVLLEHAR
jgi:uncharacterized protein YndB with AHSA1/START domain